MTPRPVVRPEDLSTSLVLAAKDGICTAAGVEILEVVTKTGVDAALSRPKGMDTRRWDQIYQMLTESFASREFKNAT